MVSLEKAEIFLQYEKPDSEDVDLIYGFKAAFERVWTLYALVSPGYLIADTEP